VAGARAAPDGPHTISATEVDGVDNHAPAVVRRQRIAACPISLGGAFDLRHKRNAFRSSGEVVRIRPLDVAVGPNTRQRFFVDAKRNSNRLGTFGLRVYLEASPTGRIVNNVAINHGAFGPRFNFGLEFLPAGEREQVSGYITGPCH